MSARIVFANGSKAMAHNNSDLYERWMLKREQTPESERTDRTAVEVYLPDLEVPEAYEDIRKLREFIIEKKMFIEARIADLAKQCQEEKWTTLKWGNVRRPLAHAITRAQLQIQHLGAEAKAKQPPDDEKWVLREKLLAAQERIIELQDEVIRLHERLNARI